MVEMDPRLAPLAVAGALVLMGLLVIAARPSSWLNRAVGWLLLLRGASTAAFALLRHAGDPAWAEAYARVTVWYTIPLPLALLLVGAVLLRPRVAPARALLGAAGAATLVLLAAHALVPGALVADVRRIAAPGTYGYESSLLLDAFSALASLVEAGVAFAIARASVADRAKALVALAFCIVPLHAASLLAGLAVSAPGRLLEPGFAVRAACAAATLALVAGAAERLLRARAAPFPPPRAMAALVLMGTLLLGLVGGLASVHPPLARLLPSFDVGAALVRGAFAAAIGAAFLRHDLAGLPERGRRVLSRAVASVMVGAAAAFAGGAALALLGRPTPLLVGAPLVALGALLLSPVPPWQLLPGAARPSAPVRAAGRYRLERELGRGATATAWLAHDPRTGARVVVKRSHDASAAPALREAAVLRRLRHPRLMPLLDVGRDGDGVWIALPHYERGTLRDLLDREGSLAPARAFALARDVADALAALHAHGVVHRDVKAENVFLDAEGRAVLGDLGSARAADRDATLTGPASGVSLSGVAPEVLRGRPAAPASDVYAAGALLHRLLTGRHYVALEDVDAFEARERILLDAPRLPDPRVPRAAEALLRTCLAKDPAARPPGAAALARALSRLEDEQRPSDAEQVSRRERARGAGGERREVDADGVARAG